MNFHSQPVSTQIFTTFWRDHGVSNLICLRCNWKFIRVYAFLISEVYKKSPYRWKTSFFIIWIFAVRSCTSSGLCHSLQKASRKGLKISHTKLLEDTVAHFGPWQSVWSKQTAKMCPASRPEGSISKNSTSPQEEKAIHCSSDLLERSNVVFIPDINLTV